ncbi:MAG TPA: ATP-binding protein, partial [Candidatus Binatia bacterium]|nr:ATP-binding protein [Candidatus Binatia bacterium]
ERAGRCARFAACVKILSTALHRYLLPFPPPLADSGFSHMQQSARIAPLVLDGKVCGTITVVEDVTEREWQNNQARREQERQELLSETLAHLLIARDPDALVRDLFGRIAGQLGVDAYLHYRLEPDTHRLRLQSAVGLTSGQEKIASVLEKGEGYAGVAIRTGRPVVVNSLRDSNDSRAEFFKDLGVEAFAAFPLLVGERLLGCLAFATRTRERWASEEIQFLHTVSRYVAMALDRTRQERTLRENEERFRVMAETVPNIIFTATPGGRFDFINQRFYGFTGSSGGSGLHFGWLRAIHPHDAAVVQTAWKHAVKTGQPFAAEFRLRAAEGGFRWFVARARPILDSQGQIAKWFGAATNVDDLKQTQLALGEAQTQLRDHAANLEKTVEARTAELRETILHLESFSYTVAHDLRAPIRAIDGFTDMVLAQWGDQMPEKAREGLNRVARAADRMDALTRDLLNYTKVATQGMELSAIDPTGVVEDAIIMNEALHEPHATVGIVRPLHNVLAHPTLFTQCVSNLLDNAAKFVAPGVKPRIIVRSELITTEGPGPGTPAKDMAGNTFSAGPHPPRGNYVRLWVEDNGIGMDSVTREKIFGLFERAREAKQYPGTGIGLAILAKAIQRMQGRFGVESEVNAGSRFWIDLQPAA